MGRKRNIKWSMPVMEAVSFGSSYSSTSSQSSHSILKRRVMLTTPDVTELSSNDGEESSLMKHSGNVRDLMLRAFIESECLPDGCLAVNVKQRLQHFDALDVEQVFFIVKHMCQSYIVTATSFMWLKNGRQVDFHSFIIQTILYGWYTFIVIIWGAFKAYYCCPVSTVSMASFKVLKTLLSLLVNDHNNMSYHWIN